MPDERNVLYYLTQLWERAGLTLPVNVDAPDEALSIIRDSLPNLDPNDAQIIEAQIGVFERALNRLTNSGIPRSDLMGAAPSRMNTFGTALDTAAANVVKRIKESQVPIRNITEIPPLDRGLTAADLPPLPDDFWQQWKRIDADIEQRLINRTPKDIYNYDPFYTKLAGFHYTESEPFIQELDKLMGVHHLLEHKKGPVMFRPVQTASGAIDRSPAGRFFIDPAEFMKENIDPRLIYLANSTIRFNPGMIGEAENLMFQYSTAGRRMRPEVIAHTQSLMQKMIENPGVTTVFDVESAGLKKEEGLWQIAAHTIDENGKMIGDPLVLQFHNATMQWKGEIGRNRTSIEEWLAQGKNVQDYPEGLKEFFKRIEDSDYIAGHNVLFDYGMISHGIKKHHAYRTDPEFKRGADIFLSKFFNEDTLQVGNIVDTAALARMYLSDITLAPELAHLETSQKFSLQNIVLQTDLLEHVRRAEGGANVDNWLKQGLHYADVDVPIERHLLSMLISQARGGDRLSLAVNKRGRGLSLGGWRRQRVIHSAAITPLSHLSSLDQLNDQLVERMIRGGLIEFDPNVLKAKKITGIQDMIAKNILSKEAIEQAGLTDAVRKIRISPMEQKVAMSRNYALPLKESIFSHEPIPLMEQFRHAKGNIFKRLKSTFWDSSGLPDKDLSELAYHAGIWQRLSKGFITQKDGLPSKTAGVFPDKDEWKAIQQELADKGIPFAGASMHERHLMASLGQVIGPNVDPGEALIKRLYGADIASLGRWVGAKQVGVLHMKSGAIVMVPEDLLIEAEKAGVFNTTAGVARTGFEAYSRGERTELFRHSPFKYGADYDKKEVGLMFDLAKGTQGERERAELLKFLKSKAPEEMHEDLAKALGGAATDLYGIQVATLGGVRKKGNASVSRYWDQLTDIMGGTVDNGGSNTTSVYSAHVRIPGQDSRYPLTAGAIIKPELLDAEQMAGIAYNAEQAVRLAEQAKTQASNPMIRWFDKMSNRTDMEFLDNVGLHVANTYMNAKKKAPLIALGAATVGTLYYRHHKNEQNRAYDQVMDYQKPEESDWYDNYQADLDSSSMPINYRQQKSVNPLSTAGLVKVLDRRKVNHTQMGQDRYGYLFSRGYS